MIKIKSIPFVISVAWILLSVSSCYHTPQFGKSSHAKIVDAMTWEEKVSILLAQEVKVDSFPGNAYRTMDIPRLGIPSVTIGTFPHAENQLIAIDLLAQSWNRDIIEQYGASVGLEAQSQEIDCLVFPVQKQGTEYKPMWNLTAEALARGINLIGVKTGLLYSAFDSVAPIDSTLHFVTDSHDLTMVLCGNDSCLIEALRAGYDLTVAKGVNQINTVVTAVKSGYLEGQIINSSVERLLGFIAQSSDVEPFDLSTTLTRSSVEESIVLLKNEGALPLNSVCNMIALYGASSYGITQTHTSSVSLYNSFKSAGYKLEPSIVSAYNRVGHSGDANLSRKPFQYRADAISSDIAIIAIENDQYFLRDYERELIQNVCEAFHFKGKSVVVVLNSSLQVEIDSWRALPDAIICAGVDDAATATVDILSGAVTPSGKLIRAYGSYPFGYGLSYTTFSYSEPIVNVEGGVGTLSIQVTNSGSMAGKEVVQLYLDGELKTYVKTGLLESKETQKVDFYLSEREFNGLDHVCFTAMP